MACARCLLQLQCVRQVGQWSTTSTAPYGSLPRLASFIQPNLLNNTLHQALRHFHGSSACAKRQHTPADFSNEDKKRNKSVVTYVDLFEQVASEARTKATFNKAVDIFIKRDVRRRGHVEFIYAALKKMPEFGVERDLLIYNKLLDVFPKEVFVPRNFIQRMFNHYPRQQECGVQLLEQMENYGIMPNMETKVLLFQIFGQKSHPMRKYQRIMYWFPKFKNINPFPIPQELPKDQVDLACFSLKRIANDLDAEVTVYQLPCTDITESGEQVTHPHVVGIQSPSQMEQLAQHNPSRPLFVEGPFPLWLKKTCVYYYILRADPPPPDEKENVPYNPERCLDYPLQLDLDFDRDLGDDESFDVEDWEEGPVFGICMTGHGDEATLNQWISGLQQKNPILGQVPTLFSLKAGVKELQKPSDPESGHQHSQAEKRKPKEEEEVVVKEELRKASG